MMGVKRLPIRVYDFPDFLLSRDFPEKKSNFLGNPKIAKCTSEMAKCHSILFKKFTED